MLKNVRGKVEQNRWTYREFHQRIGIYKQRNKWAIRTGMPIIPVTKKSVQIEQRKTEVYLTQRQVVEKMPTIK